MKKTVKKIIAMLLIVVVLSVAMASPLTAFASERAVQWEYICLVTFDIFFQGTEGSACASVDIYDHCLYAQGRITVYESDGDGGWTRIATIIDDTLQYCLVMVAFFDATPGVEYYATFELTAHGQYTYETETFTDQEFCPYPSGRQ